MRRIFAAALLLGSLVTSTALAQAPNTFSYQGVLTHDDGTLVADGNYDLTFRLFDVPVAGAALWTENHETVAVERGGFSVILGSIVNLPLIFERQLYLGISVGADPEMTPRVPLAASPYALGLRWPIIETRNLGGHLLDLENTLGATARFRGTVDLGSELANGRQRLYRNGFVSPFADLYTGVHGPNFDFYDENFNTTHAIQADGHGTGGYLSIYRGPLALGFIVDGNSGGTSQPLVSITGASRSAHFDMSVSGNASVQLPNDAISSAESFDEPGVAATNASVTTVMDGTVQTLLSRTITVPAAGYCLVIGSVESQVLHVNPVATNANFGVSDAAGVIPSTQDFQVQIPGVAPSGTYIVPVSMSGIFPVLAGANTFYLLGDEQSGSFQYSDVQLSIVYIPTAYGTVTSSLTAGGDESAPALIGAEEKREAEAFHRARLEREMAEMNAKMVELQRQLEQIQSAQASAVARKEK